MQRYGRPQLLSLKGAAKVIKVSNWEEGSTQCSFVDKGSSNPSLSPVLQHPIRVKKFMRCEYFWKAQYVRSAEGDAGVWGLPHAECRKPAVCQIKTRADLFQTWKPAVCCPFLFHCVWKVLCFWEKHLFYSLRNKWCFCFSGWSIVSAPGLHHFSACLLFL